MISCDLDLEAGLQRGVITEFVHALLQSNASDHLLSKVAELQRMQAADGTPPVATMTLIDHMLQGNASKRACLQGLAGRLGESLIAGDIAAIAGLNSRQSNGNFQPQQHSSGTPQIHSSIPADSPASTEDVDAATVRSSPSQQMKPQASDGSAPDRLPLGNSTASARSTGHPLQRQQEAQLQLFLQESADVSAKLTKVRRIIVEWPPPAGGSLSSPDGPGPLQSSDQGAAASSGGLPTAIVMQAVQQFAKLAKLGAAGSDNAALATMALLGKSLAMHMAEQQAMEFWDDAVSQELICAVCSSLPVCSCKSLHAL